MLALGFSLTLGISTGGSYGGWSLSLHTFGCHPEALTHQEVDELSGLGIWQSYTWNFDELTGLRVTIINRKFYAQDIS